MANAPAIPRGRIGLVQFAQECWSELQKVTWPSRETVIRLTLIVIIISAIISVYIFAFDNLFTRVITEGIVGSPPKPTAPPAP